MKYLMVCLGNICRSPMAEGLLRRKLNDMGSRSVVDSCGFEPYHIGDAPDQRAQKVMKEHGISIGSHRARLFHPADFDDFDMIFAMDTRNIEDIRRMVKNPEQMKKVDLIMNLLYPGENRVVPDPYYGNDNGFVTTYEVLDLAAQAVIEQFER